MPIFDFECNNCNKVVELIMSSEKSAGVNACAKCGRPMKKMAPNKMTFHLLYDPKKDTVTWSNEGFATTQRYRETDKMAKNNIYDMKSAEK